MKTRVKHVALFSPLLLALAGGGCMTGGLWENDDSEAWRQPAAEPHLKLFEGNSQTNLLVVYDEFSERNNSIHPRAYWLKENQRLVDQSVRPHFAPFNSIDHAPSVPVFYDPIPAGMSPQGLCAVVATDKQSFTLYMDNRAIGSRNLPVYNDGKGRAEKIALTPLAVTADATIVGPAIVGLIVYWHASSPEVQEKVSRGEYVPLWP